MRYPCYCCIPSLPRNKKKHAQLEGSKGSKPCARHQLSSLLPVETVVHSPHGTDTHVLFCVDGTDPRGDHRHEGKEAQQTQTLLKAHIEVFDTRIMQQQLGLLLMI